MYHGLSAYNKVRYNHIPELMARAIYATRNEVCFSDIPIGPIGIFANPLENYISYAYSQDCYSFIDWNSGFRYPGKSEYEIRQLENEDTYEYYKRVSSFSASIGKYSEFHVFNCTIDAIWFNANYDRKDKRLWKLRAKKLARLLNVPFIEVSHV